MKLMTLLTLSALFVAVPTVTPRVIASPSNPEAIETWQASTSVVKSGNFEAVEHPTQGNARIILENGRRYLEIGETFRTDEGPDLFVVLHRSASPGLHFNEGDYITLGALQSTTGTQRYPIPNDINVSEYNSAAVWCRQFNATFGAAPLN